MAKAESAQLSIVESPNPFRGVFTYETYDRWQGLPIKFQHEWAGYREPVGVPLTSKILRAVICSGILPTFTVPRVRWLIFRIMSLPCMVGARLLRLFFQ
jgi:hypothetical protein